ncbi:MAG: glucose-6-phosphate isomerase, partial [Desulfohalobiaceae bacterium]
MSRPTQTKSWQKLQEHFREVRELHLRDMFDKDPERFARFSLQAGPVFLDYSKNRIDAQGLELLLGLAREMGLQDRIQAMFSGERINATENRSVLHVALRNRSRQPIYVQGQDVMPEVNQVLDRMGSFVDRVRQGKWLGFTGQPVQDVVNLGIGGSDLGPRMATKALSGYTGADLRVHFVSNVDPAHLENTLAGLDPETTLFIVASKSFSTQETMFNAARARQWFLQSAVHHDHVRKHFVAVSTNTPKVKEFGIDPENTFGFWDWVGGRFSLWSAIGLPIALAVGMERFQELLQGAHDMDQHFKETPLEENLPVIMGLLSVWYSDFFQAETHAVLPYSQYLEDLPAYLQQGEMESNGKRITLDAELVDYPTGPVIWGAPGTNGQHA